MNEEIIKQLDELMKQVTNGERIDSEKLKNVTCKIIDDTARIDKEKNVPEYLVMMKKSMFIARFEGMRREMLPMLASIDFEKAMAETGKDKEYFFEEFDAVNEIIKKVLMTL